ncbi:hypothetical protein K6X12_06570 [Xanthomonas euvesicatoria pv. allii]|uniref:hypothetical protein n=1 Tax=Xanthomonas euvesicatoria TaxID=456327 RepID=UPI0024076941|nr:hypothetical protein [Xanthomonas euvesicatoria]MCP3050761.1 hypothetical protein [Xanthomonas euvesicatoria pv. allii]
MTTDASIAAEEPDGGSVGPGGHPILLGSPDDLAVAFVNGWIVDGRSGGLVQGRLHSEGNIVMISPSSPLGTYEFVGYMEGGEYLMSEDATRTHRDRIEEINADKSGGGEDLPDPPPGRTIYTHAEPHDKLLVIGRQFIVNRISTRKYFSELEAMNAPCIYCKGQFFTNEEIEIIMASD